MYIMRSRENESNCPESQMLFLTLLAIHVLLCADPSPLPQSPDPSSLMRRQVHRTCTNPKPSKRILRVSYLLIAVLYDGQVEKLAAMFLGEDGVHARCMGAHQLLIGTEVVR